MQVIRFDTPEQLGIFSSNAEFARLTKAILRNCPSGINQCPTFLNFYMQTVDCPSNSLSIAKLLYTNPYGTFKFGFKYQAAVEKSFGLHHLKYAAQYQWSLESGLLVRRNFAVEVAAETDTEVMYYASSAVLLEENYA